MLVKGPLVSPLQYIQMLSYLYKISHCVSKATVRSYYFHNANLYPLKTAFIVLNGLVLNRSSHQICLRIRLSLVRIMPWGLVGADALDEPMLTNCKLNHQEQTSKKFQLKHDNLYQENWFENVAIWSPFYSRSQYVEEYTDMFLTPISLDIANGCDPKYILLTSCAGTELSRFN